VHAYAVIAAAKLLGHLPPEHGGRLQAVLRSRTADAAADVQQRACELAAVLDLRGALPVRPPLCAPVSVGAPDPCYSSGVRALRSARARRCAVNCLLYPKR
jgi:hypothetical protein